MYPEKKGGSHKTARPQQNWGLLTLLTRWASIWTMPNTASPKSEPPCGRAVYTPVRATILGHPPQKTAPGGLKWWRVVTCSVVANNRPLARYVKLQVAHAPGMPGTFSPPPWCMLGLLTHGGEKCSRHSRRMRNPHILQEANATKHLPPPVLTFHQ